MILAACGSSGGNNPGIQATDNKAAQQAAAEKAAAEKAAAEKAAEKAAAEKAAAEKAAIEQAAADKVAKAEQAQKAAEKALQDRLAAEQKAKEQAAKEKAEADKKAATEKAEADKKAAIAAAANEAKNGSTTDVKVQITTTPKLDSETSFVGAKNVVKSYDVDPQNDKVTVTSNFGINTDTQAVDIPVGMDVQNPFPTLDTIVVAEPTGDNNGKRGYIEDFDFRGNDQKSGVFELKNIYLGADDNKGADTTKKGAPRETDQGKDAPTKTDTMGTATGTALVFQEGRVNYTTNYNGKLVKVTADAKGNVTGTEVTNAKVKEIDGLTQDDANNSRSGKGSVAEVYGHRTAAEKGKFDADTVEKVGVDATNNLPLQNAKLTKVQYGRVTSDLDKQSVEDYKEGLNLGPVKTFVVDYGKKGNAGTEDHFFYRGVDNISAKDLQALVQKGGVLQFDGHAVTYGFDHNNFGSEVKIPTAIGGAIGLVSGTHVTAKVDLGTKAVTGSLYNNWFSSANNKVVPATLATFQGTLADNGNIAGTATSAQHNSAFKEGVFGATLYGNKAQEMGGIVASNNKAVSNNLKATAWGAVFGAENTTPAPNKPGTPVTPAPVGNLNNSVNQKNN